MVITRKCEQCEASDCRYLKSFDIYLCRKCVIDSIQKMIIEFGLVDEVKFVYGLTSECARCD